MRCFVISLPPPGGLFAFYRDLVPVVITSLCQGWSGQDASHPGGRGGGVEGGIIYRCGVPLAFSLEARWYLHSGASGMCSDCLEGGGRRGRWGGQGYPLLVYPCHSVWSHSSHRSFLPTNVIELAG